MLRRQNLYTRLHMCFGKTKGGAALNRPSLLLVREDYLTKVKTAAWATSLAPDFTNIVAWFGPKPAPFTVVIVT